MDGKRIKSAWEIALEKAERLGRLSDEELRRQEEEQYGPVGRSLAERYLAGLPLRDVVQTLDKQTASVRRVMERNFLKALVEAIQVAGSDTVELERNTKALTALRQIAEQADIGALIDKVKQLLEEYQAARERFLAVEQQRFYDGACQQLARAGIAGSAVRPNLAASESWLAAQKGFDADFNGRLATIKQLLLERI